MPSKSEAQELPRPANKPWYREASVIISIIALVTSLGATYYSNRQAAQQFELGARVELGQLIQRLSALPKEQQDLITKYPDDPTAASNISSMINQENLVLAQQAADVIERIPDQVSATEYLAVANALQYSEEYAGSLQLIERALLIPSDITTREALLRLKGTIHFTTGDAPQGRAVMQEARQVWEGQPTWEQGRGYAYTELIWANLEHTLKNCAEVNRHLSEARAQAARLDPNSALGAQVLQAVESTSASQC